MKLLLSAAVLAGAISALPAVAQDQWSYCTRLSPDDHYASDGVRLATVGQVIRQDRANFHQFGVRDSDDGYEGVFADRGSRAALQASIDQQTLDGASRNAILNGTPYVCVAIYGDMATISSVR
jgi:hypothetical protein